MTSSGQSGAVASNAWRTACWRRLSGAGPPFFGHPVQTGGNGGQAVLELQTPRVERRLTAIPERTPDRRTVPPDDLGFRIGSVFDGPLDRPHPAYPLA